MSEIVVEIQNEMGDAINVNLYFDGQRESAALNINGVWYHFERISADELMSEYKVDNDEYYEPQKDATGYCYMLAPFLNRK